jgi:hypothetical protein
VLTLALAAALAAQRPADFDDQVKRAFEAVNQGRRQLGKPEFKWSKKLAGSAQELADWGWSSYLTGDADIAADCHHDYVGRLERNQVVKQGEGWIGKASECGLSGTTSSVGEDGKVYPPDRSGWHYPYRKAENLAKDTVYSIGTGPFADRNPTEQHVADFRGDWTHVGIGWAGGMFVIDYGRE